MADNDSERLARGTSPTESAGHLARGGSPAESGGRLARGPSPAESGGRLARGTSPGESYTSAADSSLAAKGGVSTVATYSLRDLFKKTGNEGIDGRPSTGSLSSDIPDLTGWRMHSVRLLQSDSFDKVIGLIIVLNAALIGVEQNFTLEQNTSGLHVTWVLEHIFLAIFVVELGLRFFAYGINALQDSWVRCDTLIVTAGVLTTWILEPLSVDMDGLGIMMAVRMVRLLRIVRTFRLAVRIRALWLLVTGLATSASTMCYTLILLSVTLYLSSCVGIELIVNHPMNTDEHPEFQRLAQVHFSSLGRSMLTLVQFITGDSMHAIYLPFVNLDPLLAVYFLGTILVVTIVLMNLVTAVVVNVAMEQAMADKDLLQTQEDEHRKKLLKEMKRIFLNLDEDDSGHLTLDELRQVSEHDRRVLARALSLSQPEDIFNALDVGKTGSISIDEFCEGIHEAVVSKTPLPMQRMEKQVSVIFGHLQDLMRQHTELKDAVVEIRKVVSGREEEKLEPKANSPMQTTAPVFVCPALLEQVTMELHKECDSMKVTMMEVAKALATSEASKVLAAEDPRRGTFPPSPDLSAISPTESRGSKPTSKSQLHEAAKDRHADRGHPPFELPRAGLQLKALAPSCSRANDTLLPAPGSPVVASTVTERSPAIFPGPSIPAARQCARLIFPGPPSPRPCPL
mmetsp:Transcript_63340/g.137845  ORF Transcript_63340/g.137845 Transcript_63340/m.137845 type:complete len:683 (+) Transcript_63340:3-2051(+)